MVKQKDSKESPRESHDSRRQLLEAGTRLFAKDGLEGTSVRDIAREAGTNICMISYHFGGKEGLYRACLQEFGEHRLNLTRGMLDAPTSLAEFKVRIRLFLQALVDSNFTRPEFAQIIGKEIEAGLPVAADIFEMTFLEAMQTLLKFFRHAQDAGIVKKDFDPVFIAHFLYGTINHLSRFHTVGKKYFKFSLTDQKNREKLVDSLVEILLSGVAVQD